MSPSPSHILHCDTLSTHIIVPISMFRCLPLKRSFQAMAAKLTEPVLCLLFRSHSLWKSKHRDMQLNLTQYTVNYTY